MYIVVYVACVMENEVKFFTVDSSIMGNMFTLRFSQVYYIYRKQICGQLMHKLYSLQIEIVNINYTNVKHALICCCH